MIRKYGQVDGALLVHIDLPPSEKHRTARERRLPLFCATPAPHTVPLARLHSRTPSTRPTMAARKTGKRNKCQHSTLSCVRAPQRPARHAVLAVARIHCRCNPPPTHTHSRWCPPYTRYSFRERGLCSTAIFALVFSLVRGD